MKNLIGAVSLLLASVSPAGGLTAAMAATTSDFISKITRAVDPMGVWPSVKSVTIPVRAYGPFFYMVGQGDIFNQGGEAEVFTKATKVIFTHFPAPGLTGIYMGDRVEIRDSGMEIVEERSMPRQKFRPGYRIPKWDHLDALYFFGYALWNYVNFPHDLSLPGIKAELLQPILSDGRRLNRLRVIYPEGFHTHSSKQTYYFDSKKQLFRHEYGVDILGSWLKGIHYTHHWAQSKEGVAWATRRRVQGVLLGIPWQVTRIFVPILLDDAKWLFSDSDYAIFGDLDWMHLNLE